MKNISKLDLREQKINKLLPAFNIMLQITIFPSNKDFFVRLLDFCKEVINICDEKKVEPILYGSLAVLIYTENSKMNVNDIDMLIREKDFAKIIKVLKERKIKYNHDEKWHVLQVLKDDLKIEFDSIDFWQRELPQDFKEVNLCEKRMKILSLRTLKKIYEKASEISQDNPSGNKKKFEELSKIKNSS